MPNNAKLTYKRLKDQFNQKNIGCLLESNGWKKQNCCGNNNNGIFTHNDSNHIIKLLKNFEGCASRQKIKQFNSSLDDNVQIFPHISNQSEYGDDCILMEKLDGDLINLLSKYAPNFKCEECIKYDSDHFGQKSFNEKMEHVKQHYMIYDPNVSTEQNRILFRIFSTIKEQIDKINKLITNNGYKRENHKLSNYGYKLENNSKLHLGEVFNNKINENYLYVFALDWDDQGLFKS